MFQDKTKFLRQQVPSKAREWIDTAFYHQGRSKKTDKNCGGVDCIGLIVGVSDELNITDGKDKLTKFDRRDYSRLGIGTILTDTLSRHLDEVEDIQPGDVLLFRLMGQPQHVGIVGERDGILSLIHCYQTANKVVEHELTNKWKQRIIKVYRFREWQH